MKNIEGIHFWEKFNAAACIGYIVDIDMESKKGKPISEDELKQILTNAIEIRLYKEAWFSTYDIYYKKELKEGLTRVVVSE